MIPTTMTPAVLQAAMAETVVVERTTTTPAEALAAKIANSWGEIRQALQRGKAAIIREVDLLRLLLQPGKIRAT